MYRPPSRSPRGAWANFLHRMRRERGWSQARAFKELRAGLGLSEESRASYVAIDMGDRQPRPDEEQYLRSFFEEGPGPQDEAPQAAGAADQSAIVAAIDRNTKEIASLTAVLTELVTELSSRALAERGAQVAAEVDRVLAERGWSLPPSATEGTHDPADPEPAVPTGGPRHGHPQNG